MVEAASGFLMRAKAGEVCPMDAQGRGRMSVDEGAGWNAGEGIPNVGEVCPIKCGRVRPMCFA